MFFVDRVCKLPEDGIIYLLTGMYPQKVEYTYEDTPQSSDKKKTKNLENKTKDKKKESVKRPATDSIDSHHKTKKPRKSNGEKIKEKDMPENGEADKTVEEDEEDIKKLEEKLKILKKNAADKKFGFTSDSEASQHEEKMKNLKGKEQKERKEATTSKSSSSTCAITSPSKAKKSWQLSEGPPAEETKWQQFEKLYVCTRKGVRAKDKVWKLMGK